jgi:hypothetical protein
MLDKLFMAMVMLTMNIGGRYLAMELPTSIEQLFTKYVFLRIFVLFAIIFSATHDLLIAIIITLIVLILFRYLINCDSEFCILNKGEFKGTGAAGPGAAPKVSEEQYIQAKRVLDKYMDEKYSGMR